MEETDSEINENKINFFPISKTLACLDCPYIPSIKINSIQYSINVECQNHINISPKTNKILGHFHNKMLLEDYLEYLRNNFSNNRKMCFFCNNKINIDNIYYCNFCKSFLCYKCLNSKHIEEKRDHPTVKLDLININCNIHNKPNKFFCKNCFKDICVYCLNNNKLHNKHEIINLEDILIDKNYLSKLEEEINNEEKSVKLLEKQFGQYLNFIQKKFDEYIQLRNDEIDLKRNIIYSYDKYRNNYNSIMNVKKIKFDYFQINNENEKEKNESKENNEIKESKISKNLKKLRNFKKLLNELILYEESKKLQKEKEDNKSNKANNNKELNEEEEENEKRKEKENRICYKENLALHTSKYEIVDKIRTKNKEAEFLINLRNNKLLIADSSKNIIIYERNNLKNTLKELLKINLSNSKIKTIRNNLMKFKGIYELKNGDILISMTGLSNFILNINYKTKTFKVVQEFMISTSLRVNNPLFSEIPVDPNNYEDIMPSETINNKIKNLNRNEELGKKVSGLIKTPEVNITIPNNNNNIIQNNTININNTDNNLNNINNNNFNNNINYALHAPHLHFQPMFIPHGIAQRITQRIGIPINHPLPHHIANMINNPIGRRRKRYLTSLYPLPNDDILALSNKECWILRKNINKYSTYKDNIINCERIIMVRKALSISEKEFVIEIEIQRINNKIVPFNKKQNVLYIFYNLNYEEICRKNFILHPTVIASDKNYIYINDSHSIFLMNIKNKDLFNILEINSLGIIIPIKMNNSFIIQEKESNAVVEYRIIDNEIIRGEEIISNSKVKLMTSLNDNWDTLVFKNKDYLLLLQ